MDLRLYNSLTRQTETFGPQNPARVTMYVCGPTVYNYAHIGNARPFVIFGVLAQLLRRYFPQVIYARNITDVDDKINAAASAENVPIEVITQRYSTIFAEDMNALGVASPDIEPRATAHISHIIGMIETLIERSHAYVAEGHVLFDVASFADYGMLSGRSVEDMIAGARVEVAPYKKSPADFVLWKPSSSDLPGWESPWGRGRPGWHIECSAMSEAHLGDTIDIHAGGNDLIFPHHENEIAQSTCAHGGKLFARYWLHNGFVTVEGRKMSKSLGNTLLIHDLLKQHRPETLRFLLLKAHYRQPLDWSEAALKQAAQTLNGWYGVLRDFDNVAIDASELTIPEEFEEALCNDLNTPEALAVISRLSDSVRKAQKLQEICQAKAALLGAANFIGLLRKTPAEWFGQVVSSNLINQLCEERQQARATKNYARADEIRKQLAEMGVVIEDTSQGERMRMAN